MPHDIAFIAGQLGLGGAEQQLYYLLSGLDRSRFRPVVISLGPTSNEYWREPIAKLGIPVYHIAHHLGRGMRAYRIARLLSVNKVKIVHGWVFHSNPYSALAGELAKVSVRLGSMREALSGLPGGRFLRWIGYRGLDILITNSNETARGIEKLKLTNARVQVVANGVSIPTESDCTQRRHLRSKFGCSTTDLLIGSIGRLDENKNHSMLLRVFARLANKWPVLRLVVIGDGPTRSKLARMAESLGLACKTSFPGSIPSAANYLPAMDVCCVTSYSEGMPNVVMEAAAAGLPVVATDCGDTVDLVDHGISGYLVQPDDDIAMSAHIDSLLSNADHRVRMGLAGREKMSRQFAVPVMVERISEIYEESLVEKACA